MLDSLSYMRKLTGKMSSSEQGIELLRCKRNPFYFIYNYVYIPEIGGVLKYEKSIIHPKIIQTVRSISIYHKALLMASRQLGKALEITTPIPIPGGGYIRMGGLQVGDYVLDENHQPTQVIAATDIMLDRPCFLLEFDVDEEIIADENHLWKVYDPNQKQEVLYTSKELFLKYQTGMTFDIWLTHNPEGPNQIIHINDIYQVPSVPVRCIQVSNPTGMFLCGKNHIPTHNSTIAAILLEWACNFFPRMPATILNANKTFALENLDKVKFIHSNLPDFLRSPLKYKGERKRTMDYENGSILRVFYPSSTTSPSMLARSLTSPILYADEAAH